MYYRNQNIYHLKWLLYIPDNKVAATNRNGNGKPKITEKT